MSASSLWSQIAATEAWQPCVTTLPSGQVSIKSRRSTTYCTTVSAGDPSVLWPVVADSEVAYAAVDDSIRAAVRRKMVPPRVILVGPVPKCGFIRGKRGMRIEAIDEPHKVYLYL